MRKISFILICCLFLSNCVLTESKKINTQEFVNPIFNKLLYAYGRTSWNTLLTPTSITASPDDFANPDAYIEKYDCQLLENEQDYIKYDCMICHPYLVEIKLETKEENCYPNTIIYQITDNGLVKKTSFSPKRPRVGSEEYLKPEP